MIKKTKNKNFYNSYIKKITLEKKIKKKSIQTKKVFYADHVYLPHYCKLNFYQKNISKKKINTYIIRILEFKKN